MLWKQKRQIWLTILHWHKMHWRLQEEREGRNGDEAWSYAARVVTLVTFDNTKAKYFVKVNGWLDQRPSDECELWRLLEATGSYLLQVEWYQQFSPWHHRRDDRRRRMRWAVGAELTPIKQGTKQRTGVSAEPFDSTHSTWKAKHESAYKY